jgi:dTDP-4-amino-4,6-dideoxygalactose transaminase
MTKLAMRGGAPVRSKPFTSWPMHDETERKALLRVLSSNNWGGYPSPNSEATAFGQAFAAQHDAEFGVCAANGTVTLQLALRAAGIGRGDEVIVPPLTFVATAAAPIYVGATPVFADIRPQDYTLNPEAVEAAITPRTRAVICVHLGASICDLDRLTETCRKRDLILIEDCAHMHGAKWRGRGVGSWGDFGSFSFQTTKLMTAGEGGIVITNQARFEKRLQSLINCGRREMLYEDADIEWLGHNFRITEFQAALLRAQLLRLQAQNDIRAKGYAQLDEGLSEIPGISVLEVDERNTCRTGYQYIFRFDSAALDGRTKQQVLAALNAEGIPADEGYAPLNRRHELLPEDSLHQWYDTTQHQPKFDDAGCPVAAQASQESIWLPHEIVLGGPEDVQDVIAAVKKVANNAGEIA